MLFFIERRYSVNVEAVYKNKTVSINIPVILYDIDEETIPVILKRVSEWVDKTGIKLSDIKYISHQLLSTHQVLIPLQKTNK